MPLQTRIAQLGSLLTAVVLLVGCSSSPSGSSDGETLSAARAGFTTKLMPRPGEKLPVAPAPVEIFRTIKYPAPSGALAAYITPDPGDGKKHPAIIWITGGDCNTIGDVWSPAPPENEQSASAYRKAGIVMMFPSLRGGNDNPGQKEGLLGEVDDVLAAAKYLEQQSYVDPERIYLGGHSTGGTLVLLVSELSDRFRAVFSFGPVGDVSGYGTDAEFLPFDVSDQYEVLVRSPGYWLANVQSPLWVIEGTEESNVESLRAMARASTKPYAHFVEVAGQDHFSVLAPLNELIAKKIRADVSAADHMSISTDEVQRSVGR